MRVSDRYQKIGSSSLDLDATVRSQICKCSAHGLAGKNFKGVVLAWQKSACEPNVQVAAEECAERCGDRIERCRRGEINFKCAAVDLELAVDRGTAERLTG